MQSNVSKHFWVYLKTVIAVTIISFGGVTAQTTDGRLKQLHELVVQSKFAEALLLIKDRLVQYPDDYDLLIMQCRIHAWQQDFTIARNEVVNILSRWPGNSEVMELKIDILYWSGDFEEMLLATEEALAEHPDFTEFQYKRAVALEGTGRLEEALEQVAVVLNKCPEDKRALSLQKLLLEKLASNTILILYRFSGFDRSLKNWHNTTISYSRNTAAGTFSGGVNYGNQFSISDMQYEIDFYPKLSKRSYGYVNIGLSHGKIFPQFKSGAELFYVLPHAFEISAGLRYLKYDREVLLYTGTIEKYLGSFWLMIRPTVIQMHDEQSLTISMNVRKYLTDKDHYLGVSFTKGNAPIQFITLQEIQRLTSIQERIEYQHKIDSRTFIKLSSEHQREEYVSKQFRNRYSGGLALIRRF